MFWETSLASLVSSSQGTYCVMLCMLYYEFAMYLERNKHFDWAVIHSRRKKEEVDDVQNEGLDLLYISLNAPIPYSTMHQFGVLVCIVGYLSNALWGLWNGFIDEWWWWLVGWLAVGWLLVGGWLVGLWWVGGCWLVCWLIGWLVGWLGWLGWWQYWGIYTGALMIWPGHGF